MKSYWKVIPFEEMYKQNVPNTKIDANVDKLALVNNRLQFLDKNNQPISELVDAFVKEVNLLNNGNLEALELNTDKLIWYSNSITLIISASASSSDLWVFKKKDVLFGVSKIAKIVRSLRLI